MTPGDLQEDAAAGWGSAGRRVQALLRERGRLTLAEFMAEALYGPDGYYTRRVRLGGAAADFFTSPELHPAFGALIGRFAATVWDRLGRPARFDLVEYGPGTGALCRDLLEWADHAAPTFAGAIRYQLMETSPALRQVQRETLTVAGLLDARVTWEAAGVVSSPRPHSPGTAEPPVKCEPAPSGGGETVTPQPTISGLILANELVDALPVHLVTMRDGALRERYVVEQSDGALGWQEAEASTPALAAYFERLQVWPGEVCTAEVNLEGVSWMERVAVTLDRGALLLLDYGYPAADLYAPERRSGTLLTYRQHTLGSDPLQHVGDQDITAHVDFSSLARAGERGGLETLGLISQAALLRRLGLDGVIRQLDRAPVSAGAHQANRRALLALIDPDGLGRVQALVQTRGLPVFDPLPPLPDISGPPSIESADEWSAWLPLLRPGQMHLPGPLEAEGFLDLDEQWSELMAQVEDDEASSPPA